MALDNPEDESPFDRALVRARMKELKVSQTSLAGEMGLNQSAVSNLLKDPGQKNARGVKVHEASFIYKRLSLKREPDVTFVPIVGLAAASRWNEAVRESGRSLPIPKGLSGPRSFAVQVRGDSVENRITNGEFAVVDPDEQHLFDDVPYLIENEDRETQIKVYRANPARFEPDSDGDEYPTVYLHETKVNVIGRVMWKIGKP
jgi:phage repressor protein C with HTH and peptisase S24 domain